ncbi:MAG: hypothetical protein ACKOF9_11795 [Burkholderiales bacterium]
MTWFSRTQGLALTLSLCAVVAHSAPPSLPQRNLVIEWRQIDESQTNSAPAAQVTTTVSSHAGQVNVSSGITVSTQRRDANHAAYQQLRVLNGGRATVRINHSVPVMWVEAAVQTQPNRSGSAVVQGLTWLEAGRQITLQPRWPGGEQAAAVEVQVDSAGLENDRSTIAAMNPGGSTLPVQTRSQTATTVLAPLGQWVTIARTGGEASAEQRGVVSTTSVTNQQRQLMQIRVLVP